jgi:DNA-directed RNA polymerase subunit RPC12/RpoP
MSQGSNKNFMCPHCRKRFQWSPKIADRKAQCPSCAKRIRIPMVPGRVAEAVDPLPESHKTQPKPESDTYDLDLTGIDESIVEAPPSAAQQAAAQTGRCPACNQSINPGAVICIKCGYNLKKGKRLQTAIADGDTPETLPADIPGSSMASIGTSPIARALSERKDELQPSKLIELWLPTAFMALGVAFTFFITWAFEDILTEQVGWIPRVLIGLGAQIILIVPIMLFAATLTVQMLGSSFGALMPGVFKFTSIAVGPLGVADALLLLMIPGAMALSMTAAASMYAAIYVIFCAPFLFLLFDLEYVEVMLTTAGIVLFRLMAMGGIWALVVTLRP